MIFARLLVAWALLTLSWPATATGAGVPSARDAAEVARILLRDAEHRGALSAPERFALAWQLSDTLSIRESLRDERFPVHLRAWARARWRLRNGDRAGALDAFRSSSAAWPRDGHRETLAVRRVFDRQRIECAFELEDWGAVRRFEANLLSDPEDPVLVAWKARARWAQAEIEADAVAEILDREWSRASRAERHSAAFLGRSLAHLAAGDRTAAADAWVDCIERASRPAERRRVLEFWDAHDALPSLVDQPDFAVTVARWLARSLRRPQAIELLQARLDVDAQDGDSFSLMVEQWYRVRDDAALEEWLSTPWPETLTDEQRAELTSLRPAVARRGTASVDLGREFEQIARAYPQTRRAIEALWEAGWMYEIADDLEEAQRVYDEYVARGPRAPFAPDAALRGLLMRYRQGGDLESLTARWAEVEETLGHDAARASALWLLRLRAIQGKDLTQQLRLEEELGRMDTPVPLWNPPQLLDDGNTAIASATKLAQRQADAFERIRSYLGAEWEVDSHVRDAEELLRLGLIDEGELELLSLVRDHASNTKLLMDVAQAAWRRGSAEVQARVAFLIRRRLADDGEGLQRDLWFLSRPTPFYDAVLQAGREFSIRPEVLWAIMRRESFYDPDVVSVAGARGLVQIMPPTAEDIARRQGWSAVGEQQLLQPRANLRFGAHHVREHLEEFDGSPYLALAAYNAGPSMARAWRDRVPEGEPPAFAALLISYRETRGYVYDVLRNALMYAEMVARD